MISSHRFSVEVEGTLAVPQIEYISRALIQQGDRFLVCRDLTHGHAYLPGGHVDFGESAENAASRELQEECGLSVCVGAPLLVWEARFVQNGEPKHEVTIVFHVEHDGDTPWPNETLSLEDHISFEWIAHDQARQARIVPEQIVDWLAARHSSKSPMQWLSIDENV